MRSKRRHHREGTFFPLLFRIVTSLLHFVSMIHTAMRCVHALQRVKSFDLARQQCAFERASISLCRCTAFQIYSWYSVHVWLEWFVRWRGESHTTHSRFLFAILKWYLFIINEPNCHVISLFSPCITNHKHRIYHFHFCGESVLGDARPNEWRAEPARMKAGKGDSGREIEMEKWNDTSDDDEI